MIISVEYKEDLIDVPLTTIRSLENDSIGGYEYWGSKYYDSQPDYWIIEGFTWDKTQYSEEMNKLIQEYINLNFEEMCREEEASSRDF
jgi:hypothetical protein